MSDSTFDFVIVGGGTAGLVVAARLSEDPNTSVLVLEAGDVHTDDPRIRTPAFWLSVLGTPDFDWSYRTVPQKSLGNKVVPLSQGKLLGGSSAINGLAFVANSKAAVDSWSAFGNPGWDWDTLGPYYRKSHTRAPPSEAAANHLRLSYLQESARGTDGPVQVSFPEEVSDPIPAAWVDTVSALGFPASSDPFSGDFSGGYVNALSVDPVSRTRSDAATAYLEPAKSRPNLKIVTGALVEKVVFESSGAVPKTVGVQVKHDGKTITYKANKEVILAAGVFGTPKVLELSGVGSRTLLESLGIPVVVDNPNVGENLQDHPCSSISFEVNDGVKTLDALSRQEPEALGAAFVQYQTSKSGPFAVGNYTGSLLPVPDFTGHDGKSTLDKVLQQVKGAAPVYGPFTPHHDAFVHSVLGNPADSAANIFVYAACANTDATDESVGADVMVRSSDSDATPGNYLTLCAALLFPLSRGSSHITSADPATKPSIDPRYLDHPLDLEVQARLLRYTETIIRAEPLKRFIKPNGRRSARAPADLSDLETAKEHAKRTALSCWHPTSTCAMLPLECGGVVDPQLHVHGIEGLRIVDSSIIPLATRGNTQTTVYAVAERAADLIKKQYSLY
ncbi:hypothetical protein B0H63DRAFT_404545 [Podospora didyma]|uniref:GMC oxidoreductase n=1 Tax=Podospora didyma TaxID=330526 RepID=A0AAE0K0Q1_9PEZI|nr:hypothetical protein B0H63DRAFT_404545 [Podospora didyma]